MKFLIDNALSPDVASELVKAGYDAVHVRTPGLSAAPDETIFAYAAQQDRIVVSADTDFGTLLAIRQKVKPSFILSRGEATHRPDEQIKLLLDNLPVVAEELEQGAIVVIESERIRIRMLPIGR